MREIGNFKRRLQHRLFAAVFWGLLVIHVEIHAPWLSIKT
jgi:hypothetical protein